jgi:TFIIF-interacting CTD phosphatase-like protein
LEIGIPILSWFGAPEGEDDRDDELMTTLALLEEIKDKGDGTKDILRRRYQLRRKVWGNM